LLESSSPVWLPKNTCRTVTTISSAECQIPLGAGCRVLNYAITSSNIHLFDSSRLPTPFVMDKDGFLKRLIIEVFFSYDFYLLPLSLASAAQSFCMTNVCGSVKDTFRKVQNYCSIAVNPVRPHDIQCGLMRQCILINFGDRQHGCYWGAARSWSSHKKQCSRLFEDFLIRPWMNPLEKPRKKMPQICWYCYC